MASTNSAPSATTNGSAAYQPSTLTRSSNQVRVGDALHQQRQQPPPPPCRSSSFHPMLRRRASEPLRHSHRQKTGETHTRYTSGFSQNEMQSNYIFGFMEKEYCDAQNDLGTTPAGYNSVFLSQSQTLNSFKRPEERNLNRQSYNYGQTNSQMSTRVHGHTIVDGQAFCDPQGSTHCHTQHVRTFDAFHTNEGYTDNIRVKSGQLYGRPPAGSRIPTGLEQNRNTHIAKLKHTHTHSLLRHRNFQLSGEL